VEAAYKNPELSRIGVQLSVQSALARATIRTGPRFIGRSLTGSTINLLTGRLPFAIATTAGVGDAFTAVEQGATRLEQLTGPVLLGEDVLLP
jgi:hypothetical protein